MLEELPKCDGDLARLVGVRGELRADGGGAKRALELVLERVEVEKLRAHVAHRIGQREVLEARPGRRHRLTGQLHAAKAEENACDHE